MNKQKKTSRYRSGLNPMNEIPTVESGAHYINQLS